MDSKIPGLIDLPDETLVIIFRCLNYRDLTSLCRTCKKLHRLCGDDVLWRWQCNQYFLDTQCTEGRSWYQHFISLYSEFGKYPDFRDIKLAWNKIRTFLKENCPTIFSSLQEGVSEANLTELENTLERSLPPDIRVLYRLCDGQNLAQRTQGLFGGSTIHNYSATIKMFPLETFSDSQDAYGELGLLRFAGHRLWSIFYAFSDIAGFTPGHVYIPFPPDQYEILANYDFFCVGSFKDWIIDYANKLEQNAYYVTEECIYRFYHEPTCLATTSGITVKPTVCFVPELSRKPNYFFAYRIILSMAKETPNELTCRLETRHWVITDGTGAVEYVNGPGVVGEHPIMKPGVEFSWISCCTFNTPTGNMKGHFRFRNLKTGDVTNIECPCYHMEAPPVLTKQERDRIHTQLQQCDSELEIESR